ncbi:hypothetical protein, partial [Streptomyces sp. NPDC006971]|uniref:hypothetical protein n=1 Tax=Streptomyces sp. NPDC006971 TaxID=3154784 RepID=UPI00340DC301
TTSTTRSTTAPRLLPVERAEPGALLGTRGDAEPPGTNSRRSLGPGGSAPAGADAGNVDRPGTSSR